MPVLSDYLTKLELAAEIGRAVRTLDRWQRARKGPPITFMGRTPMYRREGVIEWLRSQEGAGPMIGPRAKPTETDRRKAARTRRERVKRRSAEAQA